MASSARRNLNRYLVPSLNLVFKLYSIMMLNFGKLKQNSLGSLREHVVSTVHNSVKTRPKFVSGNFRLFF